MEVLSNAQNLFRVAKIFNFCLFLFKINVIMGNKADRNIQVMGIVNLTDDSFSQAAATSGRTGPSMRNFSGAGL